MRRVELVIGLADQFWHLSNVKYLVHRQRIILNSTMRQNKVTRRSNRIHTREVVRIFFFFAIFYYPWIQREIDLMCLFWKGSVSPSMYKWLWLLPFTVSSPNKIESRARHVLLNENSINTKNYSLCLCLCLSILILIHETHFG